MREEAEIDSLLDEATDIDQVLIVLLENLRDRLPRSDKLSNNDLAKAIGLVEEEGRYHEVARLLLKRL